MLQTKIKKKPVKRDEDEGGGCVAQAIKNGILYLGGPEGVWGRRAAMDKESKTSPLQGPGEST